MEAHYWSFEGEWLVDIALCTMNVNVLPFHYALVYPAVTDRLDLHLPFCIGF